MLLLRREAIKIWVSEVIIGREIRQRSDARYGIPNQSVTPVLKRCIKSTPEYSFSFPLRIFSSH